MTALAGAGCGQEQVDVEVDLEEVGAETQDGADSWPRDALVLYHETEFRHPSYTVRATAPDPKANVHVYGEGGYESFVLYPYCSAIFSTPWGDRKTYNTNHDNQPYYNSAPNRDLRETWHEVKVYCPDSLPAEDGKLWTGAGQSGDPLPLFALQDLNIGGYYYKDHSAWIEVAHGKYVVLHKNGKKHSTALGQIDLGFLGIDTNLTRTEVRNYSGEYPRVNCNNPRTCFVDSATCSIHSEQTTVYAADYEGDLEDCENSDSGQSYCTGAGDCVRPYDGSPVLYIGFPEPH